MASEALNVRRIIIDAKAWLSASQDTQSELIRYHFGKEERWKGIERLLKRNQNALTLRKAKNIITLNVDLRNSTQFSAKCISGRSIDVYKEFVREFHRIVRQAALLHDGVMDKTIGDGAQVLFNVYKSDLLPIKPYDNTDHAKKRAIECAYVIERNLKNLIDRTKISHFDTSLLALGGGLTIGSAFVGSIDTDIRGFEYSAYSHDTNHAGKLVSEARASSVQDWLKGCIDRGAKTLVFKGHGNPDELKYDDIQPIIEALAHKRISVLLTDPNFGSIRGYVSYVIPKGDKEGSMQTVYLLTPLR